MPISVDPGASKFDPALLGIGVTCALLAVACGHAADYCTSDADCKIPGTVCIVKANTCAPITPQFDGGVDSAPTCQSSTSCPANLPVCTNGVCGPCAAPTGNDGGLVDGGPANGGGGGSECAMFHPSLPICGPGGACAECASSDDCAARNLACDPATARCVPCQRRSDCASGVCKSDGRCAAAVDIAFVDNRGKTISLCHNQNPAADGKTPAHAFCDVSDALAAGRSVIRVAGSSELYGALVITPTGDAEVTIVGPGRRASPPATLAGNRKAAAIITGAMGHSLSVTLDGLDMAGSAGAVKTNGVDCTGSGSTVRVFVWDSAVHDSGLVGVATNECALTLDRDSITGNLGGGVAITGGSYGVTNCFVIGNGSSGGYGVSLNSANNGVFAFNSLAANGPLRGLTGALDCGIFGTKSITDSILIDNTMLPMAGGSQVGGNCALVGTVTGPDAFPGAIQLVPEFENSDPQKGALDYHLRRMSAANHTCCVDKIISSSSVDCGAISPGDAYGGSARDDAGACSVALPNHDVDGARRPLGMAWDVGAHEVE